MQKYFNNIKAVYLDVDDTLLDFEKCSDYCMCKSAEIHGLVFPKDYLKIFHRINDGLWHRIEQRSLTIDGLHEIRWNLVFKEFGIQYDGVAFEKTFLGELSNCAIKVEGCDEILEYLYGRYPIGIATNGPTVQQERRTKNAGIFDKIKYFGISEKLGISKPSPVFFEKCFEMCREDNPDLVPSDILLVGDSISADINGAAAFGMRTVWFNKKNLPVPEDCPAEKIIYKLEELRQFL